MKLISTDTQLVKRLESEIIQMRVNPRYSVIAPKGRLIASGDFSNQEMMVAAACSNDPVMIRSFTAVEKKTAPACWLGKENTAGGLVYNNPERDLHTLIIRPVYPHLFDGVPEWYWRQNAEQRIPGNKKTYRDNGKTINFGAIFDQTPEALASGNNVRLEAATVWWQAHQDIHKVYHDWKKEVREIAQARGWYLTPWLKRIRFVNESNSKGSNESPGIMAVNHAIQGTGADMGKISMCLIKEYAYTHQSLNLDLIGQVHDEVLVEGPGEAILDVDASKITENSEGLVLERAVWKDDHVQEWVIPIKQIMENVETECFEAIMGSQILIGKAEIKVAPYWSH